MNNDQFFFGDFPFINSKNKNHTQGDDKMFLICKVKKKLFTAN